MASTQQRLAPTVLIIRDGWGRNPNSNHDAFNAVKLANLPVDDELQAQWPHTLIKTSGEDAGLPPGTMGNSEVGHQNIGAGRVVDQEVMRITRAIHDESFFTNESLTGAFNHVRKTGGTMHLLGLLSDGQVHSDIEHLFALLDLAKRLDCAGDRVAIHMITDGRDVGPKTALNFLDRIDEKMNATGIGRIASVIGRYYAMDRDHRWERTAAAYRVLTGQDVAHERYQDDMFAEASSAREAVQNYYDNPTESSRDGDEFILPTRITAAGDVRCISDGDSVIFFNFRGDRPRQITKAFVLDDEAWKNVQGGGFDRRERIRNLYFCTMSGYEAGLPVSAIAFEKPPKMRNILGMAVSNAGLTQFRCAETEKFAHVTFFFNDYREEPFDGENRLLVPSPQDVSTYDQKPEMSARKVCQGVLERLAADDCEPLIIVNFANPDMVGHTGKLEAVIKALEVVDECVGQIIRATLALKGSLIVTADHGNAEQMYDPEHDSPHTAHTTYDVPLILIGEEYRHAALRDSGRLADIAPTLLEMMNLPKPKEMTGQSLLS